MSSTIFRSGTFFRRGLFSEGYFFQKELFSEGIVKGIIAKKKKGLAGFGYDPIFYVVEEGKTFAEMTIEKKNIISHRGRAIKNLMPELTSYINNLKTTKESA